jgi:hypothetical protein
MSAPRITLLKPTELHPQEKASLAGPGWRVIERVDREEFDRRFAAFFPDVDDLDAEWDVYQACIDLEAAR